MTGTGKVCAAGITDVGRRQKTNEDAIGVLPDAGFFCIADGLGVGLNGAVASTNGFQIDPGSYGSVTARFRRTFASASPNFAGSNVG